MAPSKFGARGTFVLLINNVRNRFSCYSSINFIHYFSGERKMSRVLATSSERFHHIKIQIQKLSTVDPGLSDKI